jgi:hypothetical protein
MTRLKFLIKRNLLKDWDCKIIILKNLGDRITTTLLTINLLLFLCLNDLAKSSERLQIR